MTQNMKIKIYELCGAMIFCSVLFLRTNIWYGIAGIALTLLYGYISIKQINNKETAGEFVHIKATCIGKQLAESDIRNKIYFLNKKKQYYDYNFENDDTRENKYFVIRASQLQRHFKFNTTYDLCFKKTTNNEMSNSTLIEASVVTEEQPES